MAKNRLAQERAKRASLNEDDQVRSEWEKNFTRRIAQGNIAKLEARQAKTRISRAKKWKFLGEEQA